MDLTSESFERLLTWLHPNREGSGLEYERIRALLIRHFEAHGCSSPARLADETIDRVAKTISPEMIENWVGKKERYFFRVAFYILLEDKHKHVREEELPDEFDLVKEEDEEDKELRFDCLQKCLQQLDSAKRELITTYYRGKKAVKIKNREELARKLKLKLPVLRVKALRIRKPLKACIEKCLDKVPRGLKA